MHGFRYFSLGSSPCFSSFNRPTCPLSVIEEYLALGGGPPCFTRGSTSLALLWYASQKGPVSFVYGTVTLCGEPFLNSLTRNGFVTPQGALNPRPKPGLGYLRFRSPLLTESMSLSSPAGTEMFQFPAFALTTLYIQVAVTEGCSDGFPHSDISGSMLVCQLPGAFRRLPRLSSPLDAKTSTMHPLELDHIYRSSTSFQGRNASPTHAPRSNHHPILPYMPKIVQPSIDSHRRDPSINESIDP